MKYTFAACLVVLTLSVAYYCTRPVTPITIFVHDQRDQKDTSSQPILPTFPKPSFKKEVEEYSPVLVTSLSDEWVPLPVGATDVEIQSQYVRFKLNGKPYWRHLATNEYLYTRPPVNYVLNN